MTTDAFASAQLSRAPWRQHLSAKLTHISISIPIPIPIAVLVDDSVPDGRLRYDYAPNERDADPG